MSNKGNSEGGTTTSLRRLKKAEQRVNPPDLVAQADHLYSQALRFVWRMSQYGDPRDAERLDRICERGLEIRSLLPESHSLEIVLKAFHDGDDEATDEVLKQAKMLPKTTTAVGYRGKSGQTRASDGRDVKASATAEREAGPTIEVERRAEVFRRLKDEHPDWTQDRVATEASSELEELFLTGQHVRNAFRAMKKKYPDEAEKWTWTRGERTR